MSLDRHQRHQLHRIEARLLRSDPRLAKKLGVFGKLSAGQRMPYWEHMDTRRDRIRQAAGLVVEAFVLIGAAIGLLLASILALIAAVVIGRRARLPARPRRYAHPRSGADDHPDPADWS